MPRSDIRGETRCQITKRSLKLPSAVCIVAPFVIQDAYHLILDVEKEVITVCRSLACFKNKAGGPRRAGTNMSQLEL